MKITTSSQAAEAAVTLYQQRFNKRAIEGVISQLSEDLLDYFSKRVNQKIDMVLITPEGEKNGFGVKVVPRTSVATSKLLEKHPDWYASLVEEGIITSSESRQIQIGYATKK